MVAYKSLKTKEKSSWVIPPKVVAVGSISAALSSPRAAGNRAYGRGRLRELLITKFKSRFKWGFAKVFVTRAGRLQEWSQGELQLYKKVILFACDFNSTEACESQSTVMRWYATIP